MHRIARLSAVVLALSLSPLLGRAATAGAAAPTVTIRAASHNPVVTGQVWVTFARSGDATARISGTATGVAAGAVATLAASAFPFTHGSTPLATVPLAVTSGTARFQFRVAPRLETRYRVELFASSASTAPTAVSKAVVVYVTGWATASNTEACGDVRCTIHINLEVVVPASAVRTEARKREYVYLDVVPWNGGAAPAPTRYRLAKATASTPTLRGDHIHVRLTVSYQRPTSRWWWYWESCTRDTVGKDGIGLAGHHGCGNKTVSPHAAYLG